MSVEVSIEMCSGLPKYHVLAIDSTKHSWFLSLQLRQKCVSVCISRSDLLAHAVYAIRSQQIDRLLNKVSATTVKHSKAQVLQKLGLGGGCVQLSRGTETIVCSKKTSNTIIKSVTLRGYFGQEAQGSRAPTAVVCPRFLKLYCQNHFDKAILCIITC